uniref:Beclin 2 n=1 Tax=Nannospalax galili TaxID=1026970 RepID=A0A8C6R7Q5_NANGA
MSSVCFLCQRCSQPLRFSQLSEQQGGPQEEEPLDAQDHASLSEKMPVSGKLQASASSKPLPDCVGTSEESGTCFTLIGEVASMKSLNSIQNATLEVFEILSGQKDVGNPLCEDCTDNLLMHLDAQLTLIESDIQSYRRFVDSEAMGEEERETLHAELRAELRGLEQEEAKLAQELEDMEQHQAEVSEELRATQAETEELYQQKKQYQKEYSALTWQQLELMDQLSSVENQLQYAQRQLWRLKKTNIFNTTFTIKDDGPLGIINNFRLGCLPGLRVGWNEISAAWGQTVLLLLALSKTVGLQFQRYQPVPCGNHSYLKSLTSDGVMLPLFSDGSHSVFLNNKFDLGMTAFLDCLQQLVVEVGKGKEDLCLPYVIHVKEGLIEDAWGRQECCSIRTHLNTEQQWTQALKFMLINLKWILSWASVRV